MLESDHHRWAQSTLCYANRQVRRILNLIRIDPIFFYIYRIQGRLEWKAKLWACKQYTMMLALEGRKDWRCFCELHVAFLCDFKLCSHHLYQHSDFIFRNFKSAFTVFIQSRRGIGDVETTAFWKFNLVIHMVQSLNCIDACCPFWSCSMDIISDNESWHNNWHTEKKKSSIC